MMTRFTMCHLSRVTRLPGLGRGILAAALCAALPLAGALAQASLPDELSRKQELSEADRTAIRTFVEANKSGLTGSPAEVRRAREALLAPVERPGITSGFRIAYAKALIESAGIDKLAANKENDLVAANALRLAGQSATGNTVKILGDALSDSRPQVRLAAATGLRAAFNAAQVNPALSPEEVEGALRRLEAALGTERHAQTADGFLLAMLAAREIKTPGTKSMAIERIAAAAGARALAAARTPAEGDLGSLLRVVSALRADILDSQALTTEARRAVVTFAGQLLVAVSASLSPGEPASPAALSSTKVTEAVLSLITGKEIALSRLLESPDKRDAFAREVKAIVGSGGLLQSAPYSIPAKSFSP